MALISSGLVKGMENVGDIAEEDIQVMFDTNVTGLINVSSLISNANKHS